MWSDTVSSIPTSPVEGRQNLKHLRWHIFTPEDARVDRGSERQFGSAIVVPLPDLLCGSMVELVNAIAQLPTAQLPCSPQIEVIRQGQQR